MTIEQSHESMNQREPAMPPVQTVDTGSVRTKTEAVLIDGQAKRDKITSARRELTSAYQPSDAE